MPFSYEINQINYFGKQNELDNIVIEPVLLEKGPTKVIPLLFDVYLPVFYSLRSLCMGSVILKISNYISISSETKSNSSNRQRMIISAFSLSIRTDSRACEQERPLKIVFTLKCYQIS